MALGRPRLITPELAAAICSSIAEGIPLGVAGPLNGISTRTLKWWRAQGAAGDPAYEDFFDATEAAHARAAAISIITVRDGDRDSAQQHQWWLEKCARNDFGKNETVEHTGQVTLSQILLAPNESTDTE